MRADFEVNWKRFSARRTPADYQAWRDARDWTTRKYAMWERGERMPSQIPSSIMPCPCGVRFDSHQPDEAIPTASTFTRNSNPMESADEVRL
jgi:hypothetical protein